MTIMGFLATKKIVGNCRMCCSDSLKQPPRAWYERLTEFLVQNGYVHRGVDKILFVKKEEGCLMVSQIYVHDIVIGEMSTKMVECFVQ